MREPGRPDWRNLKLETIKSDESQGTLAREEMRWVGPASTVNYRPVLSSERASKLTNPKLSKNI
jgi:hypothetical protein